MSDPWRSPQKLVQLLSGRWTLSVLAHLSDQGRRYQDLHDALDGVSYKVLTDTLRRAERNGLIGRQLRSRTVETATLYCLTDLGHSLVEPLAALTRWVDANWQLVEAAQHQWDARRKNG